jgi:hypothetical protein
VPPDRVGPVLKTCNRLIEPVNPFTLHLCGSEASISIAARHPSQSPGSGNCVVVLEVRQLMKNLDYAQNPSKRVMAWLQQLRTSTIDLRTECASYFTQGHRSRCRSRDGATMLPTCRLRVSVRLTAF